MRKGTLLLAVLLTAVMATTADAAKKKKVVAPAAPMPAYTMDQSRSFIRDAMMPLAIQPAAPAKKMKKMSKKKMTMKKKAA